MPINYWIRFPKRMLNCLNAQPVQTPEPPVVFTQADADALRGDWEQVGKDISGAIMRFEEENPQIISLIDTEGR